MITLFVMVQVVTNHILTHSQSFNFKLILQIKINSFILKKLVFVFLVCLFLGSVAVLLLI